MPSQLRYVTSSVLPVPVENAFAYHERPGALDRLIPPWESLTIEKSDRSLEVGSEVIMTTRLMGIPVRWRAKHTHLDPPHSFADTQLSGPFASWDHHHGFESAGDEQSTLVDDVRYRLPLGAVGRFFGGGLARRKIESMFAYRHRVTRDDLELMRDYSAACPLRIAVSGSSGLVGKSFANLMTLLGHEVTALVRTPDTQSLYPTCPVWGDGTVGESLESHDAIVHLAGKPIAGQRWSSAIKEEIRSSRVEVTRKLCERLASLNHKPRVLVCASATGIYGDRGNEELAESSTLGEGFLTDVAKQWEDACQPARDAGIRVVHARFGIILSPKGGALAKMLLPAKLCGGKLGSGKQWMSWISLDDCLGALLHCIQKESVVGPVNFVSPNPVTNRDFAVTLGSVLRRPALFPAPAFGLRWVMGEMAQALLLSSTRAMPIALQQSGYRFRFSDLHAVLRYTLGMELRASSE